MLNKNRKNNNQDHQLSRSASPNDIKKENQILLKQINRLELLISSSKGIYSELEPDSVLLQIGKAVTGMVNAENSALILIDAFSKQLHIRAIKKETDVDIKLVDLEIQNELLNEVIQSKRPIKLSHRDKLLIEENGILVKAILHVPIIDDQKVIGILSVYNENRDCSFSDNDEKLLINFAEFAGIAIRNSSLLKKELNQRIHSEILRKAAIEIGNVESLEQLGDKILDILCQLVEFRKATVQVIDDINSDRKLIAFRGFGQNEIDPFLLRPLSQDHLAQRVFEGKKPLILTDPTKDPDWDSNRQLTRDIKSWIGLPLIYNNPLGLITLDYDKSGYYTEELADLLAVFCSQTAVVIKNLDLLKAEQRQKLILEAISDTAIAMNTAVNPASVLSIILERVKQVVPYESANIMQIEHGIAKVKKTNGYKKEDEPLISGLQIEIGDYHTFVTMCRTQEPLLIKDINEYPKWKDISTTPYVRSYLGVPICIENEVIGFLNLNSNEPYYFSEKDLKHVEIFINQIAISIKKSQLLYDSQQQTSHLKIINETLRNINLILKTEDILKSIVDKITENLECTHCTLFIYNQDSRKLEPKVYSGFRVDRSFSPGEGLAGFVFQSGKSIVLDDATKDPRFTPARSNLNKPRSMIISPVKIGKRTIGVICADQDKYGWFNFAAKYLIDMLGEQSGIAIERANGLDLLHSITNEMVGLAKMDDVLRKIVEGAIKLTNTSTGIIYLLEVNEIIGKYKIINQFQYPNNFIHPSPRVEISNGLIRTIIRERNYLIIPDIPNPPPSHPDLSVNPELKKHYSSMVGMPLLYAGNVIGVLFVHEAKKVGNENDDKNKINGAENFTDIQISLLSTLSQLAAIAINNANLFGGMQIQNHRLDILNQIGQNINTKTFLNSIDSSDIKNDLLAFVYNQTCSMMDFTNFYIAFWNEQNELISFEFVRGLKEYTDLNDKEWEPRGYGNYLPEYIARNKKTVIIKSKVKDWMLENGINTIGKTPLSFLGTPMIAGQKTIGVIGVQNHKKENAFDDQLCEILSSIASQTAIAIEKAHLYIEVQSHNRMLGLLQQANNMLIGVEDKNLREILQAFLNETCQATAATHLAIVLINKRGQVEDIIPSSDETSTEIVTPRSHGHSIEVWSDPEHKSKVIPDTTKYNGEIPLHPLINNFSVKSVLGIPWIANGEVIGVVWLYYDSPRDFSIFEIDSIRAHFDQAASVYRNSILIKDQYRHRESMFSTIAHETRIPLVSIAGIANALKKEVENSNNFYITQMSKKLLEQTQKIELQNETILAMYGRLNTPIQFGLHSIWVPIIKAYELFKDAAQEKGCEMKPPKALNGNFPTIEMSEHHLTLAFQNLISNAIKYSFFVKPGVNTDRYITVIGKWEDDYQTKYTISIKNYGVGIDNEEIESERIFQPFERGIYSGDRGRPGMGLGLALVKQVVVNIHNGTVKVTSVQVPGGAYLTTFLVTLPIKQPAS